MKAEKKNDILLNRSVWIIEIDNNFDSSSTFTLLLSKMSEALLPDTKGNHIGEGGTFDDFIQKQKGVKFIINGGFNHYRKNFYEWKHQEFNIGDPVGITKIRNHYFEDILTLDNYGFFIQNNKKDPWKIVKYDDLNKNEKYILGCTPLLIFNGKKEELPREMNPVEKGKINPPSMLGHGMQNHPRTAVGLKNEKIVFIIVEGFKNNGGCTLKELQEIGLKLELDSLLNLDGGGSSQFRFKTNSGWLSNEIDEEDKNRILGHVIVLFDETLK